MPPDTKPVAVQIGAGKIGRGLLGELLTAGGYHVVFDDIDRDLVRELAARQAYDIHHLTNAGDTVLRICGFRVLDGNDPDAVAEAVAGADIVCTAVGARSIPDVAPVLAEGLVRRVGRTDAPLDVLVCENLVDAGGCLRRLVWEALTRRPDVGRTPAIDRNTFDARFGFAGAVVSRTVPVVPETIRRRDPLWLACEAVSGLWVNATALRGPVPHIADLKAVPNFPAHQRRKLATHNMSHAVCAYLGYQAGHAFLWQAMDDPDVLHDVRAAMNETGQALCTRFGFRADAQHAYENDLLERYRNRALGDQVRRVAADPLRKLGPEDRLIGSARLCLEEGIEPTHVLRGVEAALSYNDPEDPSAMRLQEMLQAHGREHVLREVCGLSPEEPLFARLAAQPADHEE